MNYGGYALGTWYPIGGFYQLILAMRKIAEDQGVKFHFNHPVDKIITKGNKVKSILVHRKEFEFDAIIASSDYHHSESLLDENQKITPKNTGGAEHSRLHVLSII